jgi:transposase-like protein
MPRKPKVQRTPEEKWQIVLEGLKSGNVAETCRKYEIAPTLYYRWKDEVEEGAPHLHTPDDDYGQRSKEALH